MGMTPSGFRESDPAALKKEMTLISGRASAAHFNHSSYHSHQAVSHISSSFGAACKAAHSGVAVVYRGLGRLLGL